LICKYDQPLLTIDHNGKTKLIRADELTTNHKLIFADTLQPVDLVRVTIGPFAGAVRSIATSVSSDRNDIHLLNINGIICGDHIV
jgi:hypothetical protein